jgi:replication factor A1
MFEKRGAELIGKSAEALRKHYDPASIPPEISEWIGHKFTFVVRVLYKKSIRAKEPSFEVLLIKERHGKQAIAPLLQTQIPAEFLSTSSSLCEDKKLPPLITISSKKPTDQARLFCCITCYYCKVYILNIYNYI